MSRIDVRKGVSIIKIKPSVKKGALVAVYLVAAAVGAFALARIEINQDKRLANLEARPSVVKEIVVTPSATPTATPSAKAVFKKVVPTVTK